MEKFTFVFHEVYKNSLNKSNFYLMLNERGIRYNKKNSSKSFGIMVNKSFALKLYLMKGGE